MHRSIYLISEKGNGQNAKISREIEILQIEFEAKQEQEQEDRLNGRCG